MIEAVNLTKRYGDKVAVDHISFTVAPGTVTGFLGPNGAGLDGEGNVVDGDLVAVLFGQVDGLNHGESLFCRG